MGYYEEFPNLCFVDTLDNTGALKYAGQQHQLFGFSSENATRIKRQNEKKISVIIGNPPYNANQKNENENNKNREYPNIDKRIKNTFIKNSTAQKTKLYDMYARFYRWAMDRVERNGVIALVTNRSFINSRTFDGFRKTIQDDFQLAFIVDTRSDVRMNPKIAGTTHNVFGIQTGVAIMFLVRKEENDKSDCQIFYTELDEYLRKEEKLQWFSENKLEKINFQKISPDKNNNWINLGFSDFDELLPLANKQAKLAKKREDEKALFKLFSLGVVSNRDEWVYDFSNKFLLAKINYFYEIYEKTRKKIGGKDFYDHELDQSIKWTRDLKKDLKRNKKLSVNNHDFTKSLFRPFVKEYYYFNSDINEMLYKMPEIYPHNICICVKGEGMAHPFHVIATKYIPHLQFTPNGRCFPIQRYDENKNKINNITDWGLEQFQNHYKTSPTRKGEVKNITKEDIFHYVYGVLHNPAYRKKYELNLKREFPRIPFYKDFWKWANWGKELMELHIKYEEAKLFSLKRIDEKPKEKKVKQKEFFPKVKEPEVMFGIQPKVKVKLKADKQSRIIEIDEITKLKGIPKEAWEYKLGNRSALEWILDQYKEKKPKDKTIAEKFNTYRFADYKEHVIELLQKVTTVSVETMKIIREMEMEKE